MHKYLSNKLTFFSFWLIVLVVLLHSLNVEFPICNNTLCFLQYLVAFKLAQIAVPLFFMISGYLYFQKIEIKEKVNYSVFIEKNIKRIKTVLFPYILWCTLWFLIMYVIQYLPVIRNYFPQPLHEMNTRDKILNLYYYPLNYPFWFIRELIILLLLSPLIFLFAKYLKWIFLILIVIIFLFFPTLLSFNSLVFLRSTPFLYFALGSFLALNKVRIIFRVKASVIFFLVLFWLILNLTSLYYGESFLNKGVEFRGLNFFKDIIGCLAVWNCYDLLNYKRQWRNYNFYKYSFFIFAFHGIPTLMLAKFSMTIFKNQPFLLFSSYLFIVIFVVVISIFVGSRTELVFPRLYKILTGSRK